MYPYIPTRAEVARARSAVTAEDQGMTDYDINLRLWNWSILKADQQFRKGRHHLPAHSPQDAA